ncbi:MAG: HD domain-containing protein [Saccharofermentans sp.]|nr:HD domain-containing protein [Saccharofermentans sp.]
MAGLYTNILGLIVLLSLLSLVVLIYYSKRGNNMLEILLSVSLFVSNVGYYFLSTARTVDTAFIANSLAYLGGIFLPFIVMLKLVDFSKSKIPDSFAFIMAFFNILLYITVMLSEKYTFYYADVVFDPGPPASLITTPGPFYYVRFVILGVEMALSIFFTALTYTGRRKASFRTMIFFVGMMFLVFVVYITELIVDLKYELLPICYLACGLMLNYSSKRMALYDVTLSVQEKIDEVNNYAYIAFDRNYNFMGCNTMAYNFFPELEAASIDSRLEPENYALKGLLKWVHDTSMYADKEDVTAKYVKNDLVINDRNPEERKHLNCEMSLIHYGINNRIEGYLVELVDDTDQQARIEQLSFKGERLQREATKAAKKLKSLQSSTILGMAAMIESRDNSTGGHINRTTACCALFVEHLRTLHDYNQSENYWDAVVNSSPLHDLGKIGVSDSILKKTSGLKPWEYDEMKTHAAKGAEIVKKVLADVDDKEFVRVATNVAHYHHEKYDGSGYPDHLRGEQIPFEARIMALVDVFDALVSQRYYKEPMSYDDAFKIIHDERGSHFDPHLSKIFISLKPEIISLYESFNGTDYSRKSG